MIKIENNPYVKPTECRENVVQYICDAFLNTSTGLDCGAFHGADRYVLIRKSTGKAWRFDDDLNYFDDSEYIEMRTCEIQQAFEELINAGYYMFKTPSHRGRYLYHLSRKPNFTIWRGAIPVQTFDDDID